MHKLSRTQGRLELSHGHKKQPVERLNISLNRHIIPSFFTVARRCLY